MTAELALDIQNLADIRTKQLRAYPAVPRGTLAA